MPKNSYLDKVPYKLNGIPCLIGVLSYIHQEPFRGSPHLCDSDIDYYGFTELEFDVLDRKGYPAKWLADKLTVNIEEDIRTTVTKFYSKPQL